jgi:hypothetical protein
VQGEAQPVMRRHRTVVDQRLPPVRFLVGNRKRHVGDLEEIARGEEPHEVGKLVDRLRQATAIENQRRQTSGLRGGADRQAGRTRPDHEKVERIEIHVGVSSNLRHTGPIRWRVP